MAIAIGMVEFSSIARGIYAADQMVKISEVEIVTAQTICPGKYIALVEGDVAAVRSSVEAGAAAAAAIGKLTAKNVMPRPIRAVGEIVSVHDIDA